jgi:hypothetical protein
VGSFRIYGGKAHELKCVSLNDIQDRTRNDTLLRQVFAAENTVASAGGQWLGYSSSHILFTHN